METQKINATREQRVEQALFRGGSLTLDNPRYRHAVGTFVEGLLHDDLAPRDLTAEALGIKDNRASAVVLARESGVAAGLAELAFMLQAYGVDVAFDKQDGNAIRSGDVLLRAEGKQTQLLALERVGLNLVQRMSGIATAIRCLQARIQARSFTTRIVGTRKTPWGLLDKRALHLGNGGTHRLGLGDAIVIKNNHLALLAAREEEAAPLAIEKAWPFRHYSAFIEVEVRGEDAARAAGAPFVGFWLEAPLAELEHRIIARSGDASDATLAVLRRASAAVPGAPTWFAIDAREVTQALDAVRHHVAAAAEAGPKRRI